MLNTDDVQELTMEDRLKAIAYQFITLYERWSEDRQVSAKQGAEVADLIKLFTEQVENFKNLESEVRDDIAASIQEETASAAEKIGAIIANEAANATDRAMRRLAVVVSGAENTLMRYERACSTTHWKIIGSTVLSTVATCALLVWLVIPKPVLPLTYHQLGTLHSGMMMDLVWPQLSKQEREHWIKLADKEELAMKAQKNNGD